MYERPMSQLTLYVPVARPSSHRIDVDPWINVEGFNGLRRLWLKLVLAERAAPLTVPPIETICRPRPRVTSYSTLTFVSIRAVGASRGVSDSGERSVGLAGKAL